MAPYNDVKLHSEKTRERLKKKEAPPNEPHVERSGG
jgi:hypothetical protein